MTEKEKLKNGFWYDANYDVELLRERENAEDLYFEFNSTKPSEKEKREEILKKLLPNMKKDVVILSPFYTDYGYNCIIGEKTFINHNAYLMDGAEMKIGQGSRILMGTTIIKPWKIKIGKNCFIGPNCGIYTANHPVCFEERNRGFEKALPVTIKDNVWIGGDVTILPGVVIGENSVIGAKSLVTKDIPADVIAFGNPCRVIRKISEKDKIFMEENL